MTRPSNTTAKRALERHMRDVRYHQGAALGAVIEAGIRAKAQAQRKAEKAQREERAG